MYCNFKNGPVILVSTPIAYTFPNSYAYLASYLKQQGETVQMIFKDAPPHIVVQRIMATNPVLVGFGNLYTELKEISEMIHMLDQAGRKFPIIIGGQMVSPIPEFAVKISKADFGAIGESEIILYQLVRALREGRDPLTVNGLAIRDGDKVVMTGPGEIIFDLTKLPPVSYELFPEKEWLNIGDWYAKNYPHQILWKAGDKVINVHGGRGCPFSCNFCYHHSKARYRPIDIMMAEAKNALTRFNGNMLYFSDDLVLSSPNRAKELVTGICNLGKSVEWSISSRFDILSRMDDALLVDMKAAGCRIMGLGAESGSDRILQIIGKSCTADQIRDGIRRLTAVGILPTVTVQFGQHTETVEDAEASIQLVRDCVVMNPHMQWNFTITTPFPGSPLYNMLIKNGNIKDDADFYNRYYFGVSRPGVWHQIVNFSAMTDQQVHDMYNKMWKLYKEDKARILGKNINQVC